MLLRVRTALPGWHWLLHLASVHAASGQAAAAAAAAQDAYDACTQTYGADHPLTLQMTVQLNGTGASATTHFTIPYVAWGMKDESTFMLKVDKEVTVDIDARGTVEGLSPAK